MKRLLAVTLACLGLASLGLSFAAVPVLHRADWMIQVRTDGVRWLGAFADGQVLLGQDTRGRPRLALERPIKGSGAYIAWATTLSGPPASVSLLKLKLYSPLDILVQIGGDAPAVIGLDAHTGQERWREPGKFVSQNDVRVVIEHNGQRIQRNIFTRARIPLAASR